MKKYTLLFACCALISGSLLTTTGCKKEDTKPANTGTNTGNSSTPAAHMVRSLEADEKVYFSLSTGEQVAADKANATNWDISFHAAGRSIAVAVNSGTEGSGTAGAQIVSTGFDDLKEAPASGYLAGSEATGDFMKWCNYTGTAAPAHAVLPKPGLSIVVKTADGKYAKLQMVSLYKGNPDTNSAEFADLSTRPAFGYFTFRYATQKDGSRKF